MVAGDVSLLPVFLALYLLSQALDEAGDDELSLAKRGFGLASLLVFESGAGQGREERSSALQEPAREDGPQQAQDSQVRSHGKRLDDLAQKPASSVNYLRHRFGVGGFGVGNLLYHSNRCSTALLTPSFTGN
jgi:hypothetical protein